MIEDHQAKKRLGGLCLIAIAAILGATLWPFNPWPQNHVSWIAGSTGIRFDRGGGVVVSESPLEVGPLRAGGATASSGNDQSCSLELLLRPADVDSGGTILTFYDPDNPVKLAIRQWTDGLLVTHDRPSAKQVRTKFDVDHAFQTKTSILITIASNPNGTTVYLDGKKAQDFPKFRISWSDLTGEIIMGTPPVDYQSWQGEILGLAIYARELTPTEVTSDYASWIAPEKDSAASSPALARYTFSERSGSTSRNQVNSGPNLDIPAHFFVPHKAMLKSPVKEFSRDWSYVYDVIVNIVGFAPLGIIVCAYLELSRTRSAAIFYTILIGAILSCTVESLQAFIPRRASGITDIITNTSGSALGAWLAGSAAIHKLLEKMKLVSLHGPV